MPDNRDEIVPIGSLISVLWWWNTPDKYAGPARFDTLKQARAYNSTAYLTVEVQLTTPDQRAVRVVGAVSSVDSFVKQSPRQQDGVLPQVGASVVGLLHRDKSRVRYGSHQVPTEQTRIEDAYEEIVFRGTTGGQFVLLPLTTHPMQA